MSFISKQEFINEAVLLQPQHMQEKVYQYRKYALENGARECNDGFPDCNFKATFRDCDVAARKFVAKVRQEYDYNIRMESALVWIGSNLRKGYVVAKPEVAKGYIAKMKAMFD